MGNVYHFNRIWEAVFITQYSDFNLTMICISHDLRILRNLADRIIIVKEGEIVESGITKKVFNNPKEDYTKFLLSAEALNLTYEELKATSNS